MNKSIFVLLCLFGLAVTLRVSHDDSSLDGAFTSNEPTPPKTPEEIKAETQANFRLFAFIQRDASLRKALAQQKDLNQIQLKKLTGFMVNDPFFQKGLLESLRKSKGNEFVSKLSQPAQIRFLRIITSVVPSKLENPATQKTIASKLLRDKQIGPVVREQFGDEIGDDVFSSLSQSLAPPALGHLMALLK